MKRLAPAARKEEDKTPKERGIDAEFLSLLDNFFVTVDDSAGLTVESWDTSELGFSGAGSHSPGREVGADETWGDVTVCFHAEKSIGIEQDKNKWTDNSSGCVSEFGLEGIEVEWPVDDDNECEPFGDHTVCFHADVSCKAEKEADTMTDDGLGHDEEHLEVERIPKVAV